MIEARGTGRMVEVVVAAAQVLDQCVPFGDGLRGALALQSAHRLEPGFEPATAGQGYNTAYDQVLPSIGVSFPAARQKVERWSLPLDARLVWARSFDTCAAADYVSPTVRSVVPGSDGNVTVVFGSDNVEGNEDGSYLPIQLSDATFGTMTTLTPDGFTC